MMMSEEDETGERSESPYVLAHPHHTAPSMSSSLAKDLASALRPSLGLPCISWPPPHRELALGLLPHVKPSQGKKGYSVPASGTTLG